MRIDLKDQAYDLLARTVLRVGATLKRWDRLEKVDGAMRLTVDGHVFLVTKIDAFTLLVMTDRLTLRSSLAESFMEYFEEVTKGLFLLEPASAETAESHFAMMCIVPNPDLPPRAVLSLRRAGRYLWRAEMRGWNGVS